MTALAQRLRCFAPVTGGYESAIGRETTDTKGTKRMADNHNAEYKPGSMDIREQEKTFAGFIRMSIWVVGIVIAVLIFMGLVNA